MSHMKAPKLDERLVQVLDDDVVQRLIDSCKGNTFENLRDSAILRLFADTPTRRSEMVSITVEGVDLDRLCARVVGKGDKEREVYFSAKTAKAIERYLRLRDRHKDADHPALWLGRRGPLKSDGLKQMLERRGNDIGVHVHAHQFRHTFAHNWLVEGGQEQVLMMFTGWKSRAMVDHYAKSAARSRAEKAYHRQRPGDRWK